MKEIVGCPKDQRALIAVDLGAESCRVSLLRWLDGRPVVNQVHRFPNAPRMIDGRLRWDLSMIETGLDRGLRKCAAIGVEGVRSIAVDGWAVDYVRLDQHGAAIADPYCYRDERTLAAEESLHRRIAPQRIRELTGVQLMRINTLYQLHAEALARSVSAPWLNLPEYILSRWGGARVAEMTNATHSQLIDLNTSEWCGELFEAAGADINCAPRLVPPGTIVGGLRGALAKLAPFSDTTLIAPACHDTASAIAGISASGDDWAYISAGTWTLVGTLLDAPLNSPEARMKNFTNLAAVGGTRCFHKNVNGMWLLRQCLAEWEGQGIHWDLSALIAAAERVRPPVALLDVDDPDLMLAGGMPARINQQLKARGLDPLDTQSENVPAFASLIFHSLAARYASVLEDVAALCGRRFKRIFIVGGGSRNFMINRLIREATGLDVVAGSAESSTLGNFAVQLAALEGANGSSRGMASAEVSRWASCLQPSAEMQT